MTESRIRSYYKIKNPDKEYPSALGQLWTKEEEDQLLDELSQNVSAQKIAENHNRTIGGINSRIQLIAYKLHKNNASIEEIAEKTKIFDFQIPGIIEKYNKNTQKQSKLQTNTTQPIMIENEILEVKKEMKMMNQKLEKIFKLLQQLELS